MNKEELINELRGWHDSRDIENAHCEADDLLIEFINDVDIKNAYDKIQKWYS